MAQLPMTGGAGFIGSHTYLVLLQSGHRLVVLDDFSNRSPIVLERVGERSGSSTKRASRRHQQQKPAGSAFAQPHHPLTP